MMSRTTGRTCPPRPGAAPPVRRAPRRRRTPRPSAPWRATGRAASRPPRSTDAWAKGRRANLKTLQGASGSSQRRSASVVHVEQRDESIASQSTLEEPHEAQHRHRRRHRRRPDRRRHGHRPRGHGRRRGHGAAGGERRDRRRDDDARDDRGRPTTATRTRTTTPAQASVRRRDGAPRRSPPRCKHTPGTAVSADLDDQDDADTVVWEVDVLAGDSTWHSVPGRPRQRQGPRRARPTGRATTRAPGPGRPEGLAP